MTEAPAWLAAWRGANPERAAEADERGRADSLAFAEARAAARQPRKRPPSRYKNPKPTVSYAQHMTGFQEPDPWPFDQCQRREKVLDHDHRPPRVVRTVGWNLCLRCRAPFFSADVRGIRMCPRCKGCVSE